MRIFLVALLALLILLQYKLWVDTKGLPQVLRLKKQSSQLQQQNEDLEKKNKNLQNQVASYRQGNEMYEGHAREDLGMVKQDEDFYLDPNYS
ncbi:MAG: hypothetical protein A3I12_04270 [Gammaproteobacteria bacterium RIFCSPLOWO2_02_FULL_38_11]|nr:MAG: hypothetical protein A3B69_04120 [Gammaproteobacteria bacterium RIFCSPHIGHO2_02_FULL_38_33]OGT24773.1 MAG: hypothetical protein A2W47_01935 [Gammaproteobacteria bacterium RIFCSPHIGHO2_12_38_15]OGT67476.1 MAG: hypothetical protein A3I12_04270 [Gammaproteobacteria bacterium RIFCSPLOWO2_02_FULL_38_11]OGT76170.1 MAG: hypothetical protein A3G71_04600 [Gammaproteobacteria bacterium RIFCSPLOWO2_12_FULL_38_14]